MTARLVLDSKRIDLLLPCFAITLMKRGMLIRECIRINKMTESEKSAIIELFGRGHNLSEISNITGFSSYKAREVLREKGLYDFHKVGYYANLANEQIDTLAKMYNDGKTLEQIRNYLITNGVAHITERNISKILRAHGVTMRTKQTWNIKYHCDPSCFDVYTPESCYWAGLLAADGCVFQRKDQNSRGMILSLTNDKPSIEGLRKFLKYDGSISCRRNNLNTLNIVSSELFDILGKRFNIVPRKTLIYTPPANMPHSLRKYFIIGYIDGDGCITYATTNTGRKQFCLMITGTYEMCSWVREYFGSNVKLHQRHPERGVNNYTLSISGNVQLEKLLTSLYDNEHINSICMQRKYEKYLLLRQQLIDTYGETSVG